MITRFHDRAYLHVASRWFVWEPAWSLFRPVDGLAWDGTKFVLDDAAYCADITDRQYGFGSEEMYQLCSKLSEAWADEVRAVERKYRQGQGEEDVKHLNKILNFSYLLYGVGLATAGFATLPSNPISAVCLSTGYKLSKLTCMVVL